MSRSSVLLRVFAVLSIGSLSLSFLFRTQIIQLIWKQRTQKVIKARKKILIVDSKEKWKEISSVVCRDVAAVNILGFDCEWVHTNGKRKPVALMQLATYSGYCVLIRLNCLQGHLPSTLQDILKDRKIIKVGVSCGMDASYLASDYGLNVRGWMDLRHLAVEDNLKICSFGLQGLTKHYLGKTLNKDWKLRSANWEARTLTQQQVIYASEDALVGAHILLAQLKNLWKPSSHSFSPAIFLGSWEASAREAITEICQPYIEVDFHNKSSGSNGKSKKQIKTTNQKNNRLKSERMSYSIRKSPLYHNSQLWAPDGEPLCTCDPKKALWYVEKGLGDLISEEPLVVKLRFEPAGRPNREGLDGQFYLQERLNNCVVCGKEDSYIRKNVVPHEYRKYFPEILKSHQSHDVVLLCTQCHKTSNIKDIGLRQKLSEECDAPIGCETDVKLTIDGKLKSIRSAGGALKKSRDQLPPERIQHLENILKKYFETDTLTEDLITQAADLDTQILNEEYTPHGYKVFKQYEKIGLIQLETRWRQWFLDTMSPKYMPENWSVSHNHRKLKIKMARYPLDAQIRRDYKVALVGTDGEINIPYQPNRRVRESAFYSLDSDPNLSDDSLSEKSSPERSDNQ